MFLRFLLTFLCLTTLASSASTTELLLRAFEHQAETLQFSPKCTSCNIAVSTARFILKFDASKPVVLKVATIICKLYAKQKWVVCDGISNQFEDEFFYVFRNMAHTSSEQICGIMLPDCADPEDPTEAGWNVALPPKPEKTKRSRRFKKKEQIKGGELTVLQLSDLHVDLNYVVGAEAACTLPVCCRNNESSTVLHPAGYWGTVGACDIPLRTLKSMLNFSSSLQPDIVLLTGDYIHHVDWQYSKDGHLRVLGVVNKLMKRYFPNVPVYWAFGNHEGVPVNSFAPHNVDSRFWPTWLYSKVAEFSNDTLGESALEDLNFRGSFATQLTKGFRLISLNTGYCEATNFFLYLNQSDPDGTMSWLVRQLFEAETSGDRVLLMAHIPPGDGECLEGWARNYYRVIQRFADTVTGQLFGHVHTDFFTVFYENMDDITSKPISVAYAAPSATTFEKMNPAFRIYHVDTNNNFVIRDFDTYYTDVAKSKAADPLRWRKLYSPKEAYGLRDLSPSSWNDLILKLYNDDITLRRFIRYAYRTENPECHLNCEYGMLCQLRMGHHNESLYCPDLAMLTARKAHLMSNRVPH